MEGWSLYLLLLLLVGNRDSVRLVVRRRQGSVRALKENRNISLLQPKHPTKKHTSSLSFPFDDPFVIGNNVGIRIPCPLTGLGALAARLPAGNTKFTISCPCICPPRPSGRTNGCTPATGGTWVERECWWPIVLPMPFEFEFECEEGVGEGVFACEAASARRDEALGWTRRPPPGRACGVIAPPACCCC